MRSLLLLGKKRGSEAMMPKITLWDCASTHHLLVGCQRREEEVRRVKSGGRGWGREAVKGGINLPTKKTIEKEKSPTQSDAEDPVLGALSAAPGADR